MKKKVLRSLPNIYVIVVKSCVMHFKYITYLTHTWKTFNDIVKNVELHDYEFYVILTQHS
jgi:hypothetical protein